MLPLTAGKLPPAQGVLQTQEVVVTEVPLTRKAVSTHWNSPAVMPLKESSVEVEAAYRLVEYQGSPGRERSRRVGGSRDTLVTGGISNRTSCANWGQPVLFGAA